MRLISDTAAFMQKLATSHAPSAPDATPEGSLRQFCPQATRGRSVLTDQEWHTLATRLTLSPRELQILQRVFDDEKELAIAESLGISRHTVHTHLARLYRKLGVGSRCEALVRIFGEHLASLSTD